MGHTNQAPHRTAQASSFTAPSSTAPSSTVSQAARAFTRNEKVPTAIVIGGGPSGLISARRLAAAGMRVTLLEQRHHLGGAVGAHEVGGLLLDSGAESFATRSPIVSDLVKELGLGDRIVTPNSYGSWLYLPQGARRTPSTGIMGIPGNVNDKSLIPVIGKSGLREKDVVLSIARETKKRMEGMGYKVYMTRNEDVFIPLGVRVAKARKLNADLFISIHADAFTSPSARGTGVYTLSTKGASSAAAKFLAQTQNNADAIGGVKTGGNKDIDSTILDMTQTVTNKDSAILGKKVLNELGKYNKLHKGDIDQANFAVLRAPDIPSILVETAFLSNPEEERKLSGMVFRRQCADAITAGVRSYLAGAVLARR